MQCFLNPSVEVSIPAIIPSGGKTIKFWSKGLGNRSLRIACGSETPSIEGGKVLLKGRTLPPLSWEYVMSMGKEDWIAFFELAFHPLILLYLLRPRRLTVAIRALAHLTLFMFLYLCLLPVALFFPPLKEEELLTTYRPHRQGVTEEKVAPFS